MERERNRRGGWNKQDLRFGAREVLVRVEG